MATLRDIQRRIRSVQSTQKITRAMKLVAAAKLRRAQERIVEARPYASKMGEVLSSLALRCDPKAHPLLARRETGRKVLLVITADKGLCGAFNSNIIRRSLEILRGASGDVQFSLTVVGRKSRDFYRRRPYTIRSEYVNFFDKLAYAHAAQMAQDIIRAYVQEECDEVELVYNEFRSVTSQRVKVDTLLPIRPLERPGDGAAAPLDYLYEPTPAAILERLLPKHVETQVYRALMESLAGEYGARMTAMDNATRNASEMIDMLTLQFNKARQEKITKELLEIVGGAEALRQAGG
ncbi:MAG TPA: ATP synthase F1 subunit gamma [Candidatus Sulfotelmatobacter sp.]|nr:ATP synthase F1 subunit gamma [Candidatus Sulfotelmatobacter sp.]